MDQATKDKLKAAGLDGVITAFEALEASAKKAGEDLAIATKAISEKDVKIKQQGDDLTSLRKSTEKEYKLLKDMTAEEKAQLSAKEIELQERQEKFETDQKKFQDDQAAFTQKEVAARRERAINKIAGTDPELRKKVADAFTKIVDHDKAQTDEEIASVATSAFNMLGVPKPEPVRSAMGGEGGGTAGGEGGGENFSDQKAGKDLAAAMGLPVEAPKV